MKKVLIAPRKYVQGPGVLSELGTYVEILGKKVLVLWDSFVKDLVGQTVLKSLKDASLDVVEVDFQGDTTREESARLVEIITKQGIEVVIGVGGGKTLDTVKAAAIETNRRIVTCPTIASTDSPTSAATVWYDQEGNCTGFDCWPFNPDLVMVDSKIIAQGPTRAFVAGMGDALSTGVEAAVADRTNSKNLSGAVSTRAAMTLAKLAYDILMEYGIEAKRAVEVNALTPAVEKVIEANVLLSGLGFESGGLASAHMIANCLPSFPECHGLMHGEEVSFGIITQLCMDDDILVEQIHEIVDFQIAIGLPVTFAELNLEGITRERLKTIGDICAGEGSLCHHHPFDVTSDLVVDAMIAADALGRERKSLIK